MSLVFTPEGRIRYQVYVNTTPRTAPLDYSDMWWAGREQNGWGVSIQQHSDRSQFNVLFVYDRLGKPTWFVMPGGAWSPDFRTYSGPLYAPKGPPLDAFDSSRVAVGTAVGQASLTFDSARTATMRYTIGGVSGFKTLTRQAFGTPDFRYAAAVDYAMAPRYLYPRSVGDLWWGGVAQNGWGLNIAQQYRTLFAVWYTYGKDGVATWYVLPGGSWSDDVYVAGLYSTKGSAWLGVSYDANALAVTRVGSMTMRFVDDRNAQATYEFTAGDFAGIAQTKTIVRQPF